MKQRFTHPTQMEYEWAERVAICAEAGIDLRRCFEIAQCETVFRRGDRCTCGVHSVEKDRE